MLSSVPGFWLTKCTLNWRLRPKTCFIHARKKLLYDYSPYGMGGVIGAPFVLLDWQGQTAILGLQTLFSLGIINVAVCQDHIIWIRNCNHGNYVLYNSKTTGLLFCMVSGERKMNLHDTWKHSWEWSMTMSEWILCYRSKVNFCLCWRGRELHFIKTKPVQ